MPVSVHGFSVTAGMVGLLNIIIITAIGGAIKAWPKLRELGNSRRKDEMDSLRDRVSELEAQISRLVEQSDREAERAHRAEMRYANDMAKADQKIFQAATAVELVIGELEKVTDDSAKRVIKRARDLIAMAATDGSNFGGYMQQLAHVKGVGE